jgi:heme-degrading monooxygenase HmoA
MIHVIIRHKVADYPKWKEAFDSHLNRRMAAGESGFRVFQSVEDPREVTILLDWESLESARRFMVSEDLKSAMQKAGVVGAPDITFVQDAMNVRRTSAD